MECRWIFHGEMALWHLGTDTIIDLLIEGRYDKRKIKVTGKSDAEALVNMVKKMIDIGAIRCEMEQLDGMIAEEGGEK